VKVDEEVELGRAIGVDARFDTGDVDVVLPAEFLRRHDVVTMSRV
jgi:hypothetical protein